MRIAIGADHHEFALKNDMMAFVEGLGHEVADHGPHTLDPADDYPRFRRPSGRGRDILICGSGLGAAITANKYRGVRASPCHGTY